MSTLRFSQKLVKLLTKKKLKVYRSLESLPNKAFDIISLWHVLEHLPQTEEVITKIHDLLTSKGVLIVAVPNFSSHDSLHYKKNWAALDVPRHLWHFTPEGLEKMFFSAGFKLLKKSKNRSEPNENYSSGAEVA